MFRATLKSLLAHKLRMGMSAFAIVLGVAFVAGTFVFTDTIDASFKDLFERTSKGVDVSVQSHLAVEADFAQAHDLVVAPHGSQDIHIHLVTAIQNGLILEYYRDSVDPMHGKVYNTTLRLNDDGTVSPPEVPGIGIDPNYKELEPYRVA